MTTLNQQIDALLPQTQCQRCGYPRCAAYADAIAAGTTNINRCPPGNEYTRTALAHLLNRDEIALDPECGEETARLLFTIDESKCIGCTLCIQACPVDAIVGSAKKMHTIIASECTGCELCVPACPVDCIDAIEHPAANTTPSGKWPGISDAEANVARQRIEAREKRLARIEQQTLDKRQQREATNIKAEIAAAVERVKRKQHRE